MKQEGKVRRSILNARKEASEMNENSEREGNKAAREYYEKEMEKIKEEIEQLQNQSNRKALLVWVLPR